MSYYHDLSAESSVCDSGDDGDFSDASSWDDDGETGNAQATSPSSLWNRSIFHLDLDCFYCQCEEIDRNLRDVDGNNPRPLAIGQKHIIVTSNYEARRWGVQKLQARDKAYLACPPLQIVEGSDLRYYRRHSRKVYQAFRDILQKMSHELFSKDDKSLVVVLPARKGHMDEMVCDLTLAVEQILKLPSDSDFWTLFPRHSGQQTFEYAASSDTVPRSQLPPISSRLPTSRQNVHDTIGASAQDVVICRRRLNIAVDLAHSICNYIHQTTGFHTTGGVSVSPLLAKLASGVNKPKSVNLLLPWKSSKLMYTLPLQRMYKIGRRTKKVLEQQSMQSDDSPSLLGLSFSQQPDEPSPIRTVHDLLTLPRHSIRLALKRLTANQGESHDDMSRSEEQCDLLLQQCRGLDHTVVEDDLGAPPKSVSVEDSFRRGTRTSVDSVKDGLQELYKRLPLLLEDRTEWSLDSARAYPTTIRLSMRFLDSELAKVKKRRPYVVRSRQAPVDGKHLFVDLKDPESQARAIQAAIEPLLGRLLSESNVVNVDVTRINIAVAGFQDLAMPATSNSSSCILMFQESTQQGGIVSSCNAVTEKHHQTNPALPLTPTPKRLKSTRDVVRPFLATSSTTITPRNQRISPHSRSNLHSTNFRSTRIDQFFRKK